MTSLARFAIFPEDRERIARGLARFLPALEHKRFLLAGCTGFIGRWLVDALLSLHERYGLALELTVLTRSREALLRRMPHLAAHGNVCIVEGDVTALPEAALPSFDLAVHGVNLPASGRSDWAACHCSTAVLGTERLFHLAALRGCRRILLLSSGAVYGTGSLSPDFSLSLSLSSNTSPLREEDASMDQRLRESSLYGETKRFLELYAAALGRRYGIAVPIARCFAFSGAFLDMNGSHALANFLADALAGRDIVIRGDGTPQRSFLYGSDMAVWLLALLVAGEDGLPCNVGSARGVTIRQLAGLVSAAAGGGQVRVRGETLTGNAPSYYVPDTSRICRLLGVQERVSLEDGIGFTLAWLRAQRHNTQGGAGRCNG